MAREGPATSLGWHRKLHTNLSIQNLSSVLKNCIADSMVGGQAKEGNRDTRREREIKEDVSKMGCTHEHFYI